MKRWENGKYIELTPEEEAAEIERQAEAKAEIRTWAERETGRLARIATFRAKAKTGRVTVNDLAEAVLALMGE